MTILLTGKSGQLGSQLHQLLTHSNRVIAIGRDDLDLCDCSRLSHQLRKMPHFDLIVNTAAYTAVDLAETDSNMAYAVNAAAPAILAEAAKRRDIPIIHFSTDYVFDGNQVFPYAETDQPHPLSLYGHSKLEGENRIRETLEKHLIVRTSGMYHARHDGFLTTMLRIAHSKKAPRVVHDQIVSPNYSTWIAQAVNHMIRQVMTHRKNEWGIYHLSGGGKTSWYEFARLIFENVSKAKDVILPVPIPVSSLEYGAKAKRPHYSVLGSTRFERVFQYPIPSWEEQFYLCMEDMAKHQNDESQLFGKNGDG